MEFYRPEPECCPFPSPGDLPNPWIEHRSPTLQMDSKLGKEYVKAVFCHLVYLTYAEYIMRNTGLDEAQAGIKIARRNINDLRYADDTPLMAKNEEELRSHLMMAKEEKLA